MASLPSPRVEAAVPTLDNTPAPTSSSHAIETVSPGPGSSADSYNDDEELSEKQLGKEAGELEAGGTGTKKESFLRKKRELNPLRWQPIPPVPETQNSSAEAEAGLFSKLTLSWIGSLMRV